MKLKVFSIYDSKAEYYMTPFMCGTKGEALRIFSDAANDPQSFISKHPADYTLFEIAGFDRETGKYESLLTNVPFGLAHEFVTSKDN